MSNQIRWLYDQLGRWTAQGLISDDQAARIRDLYPAPQAALPWGLIVFSGIGAIVAGLGVILLGAYNWHVIPKFGKLAIILGVLAAAHATGLWLRTRTDWRWHLGEVVCLLGSMFFGAGIWLIAQLYHIEEHFPNGFLIWGLGVLAMSWALPSVAHGLLATGLLTVWGCLESWEYGTPVHWAPLVLAVGSVGLAYRTRSLWLWLVGTGGLLLTVLANTSVVHSGLMLPVQISVSALLVALSLLVRGRPQFVGSEWGWALFGWLGFVLGVYLLGFSNLVPEGLGWQSWRAGQQPAAVVTCYRGVPLGLALLAWVAVACVYRLQPSPDGQPSDWPWEDWLLPLTALITQLLALRTLEVPAGAAAAVYNLVFLAVAVMWMARGCRAGRLRPMLLGSLMLVALTTARYFDLFESLAVRGFLFLLIGGILFAEGFFYRHARRQTVPAEEKR